jgi:hypothetical protein
MTTDETPPPNRQAEGERLLMQASSFSVLTSNFLAPTLGHFARLQKERAAWLGDAEARLRNHLGEHRRVSALSEAAETARGLGQALRRAAARETRRPKPLLNGWMVSGRVVDPEGRPVSGAHVRLFDEDLLWDDLIRTTATDEYGYFDVLYSEGDFGDIEDAPDLYLVVEDREGNELYRSEEIRYEANRIEYFDIVLGESPSTPPWMVSGRVVNPEGRPVSGARVRVFARDALSDDPIGTADTDKHGYFDVVYSEGDFGDIEDAPDLSVRVGDPEGNRRYEIDQEKTRYEANQTEYFDIVLSEGTSEIIMPDEPTIQEVHEAPSERRSSYFQRWWNRFRGQ